MLDALWARKGKSHPATKRIRSVRFHAERLEDRMLMSANDPAKAIAHVLTARDLKAMQIADQTVVPSASVVTNTKKGALAADAPWQRFKSREDLRAWLIDAATAQWGSLFGQTVYSPYYNYDWNRGIGFFGTPRVQLAGIAATDTLTASYSTTNLQVEGVDEADLVETDGNFIYMVSGQDLVIVRAGEGEELKIVSRIHLDERPAGMYLSGNRLAIVSSSPENPWFGGGMLVPLLAVDIARPAVAFGGLDSYESYPSRPTTTVTVLDITDRAAPTLVQKTQLDGRLLTSRAVNGELRLVLTNDLHLPVPITKLVDQPGSDLVDAPIAPGGVVSVRNFMATDLWLPPWTGEQYVYETLDEYVARVSGQILDSFDAHVRTLAADGSVISDTSLLNPTEIYRPDGYLGQSLTTIAIFDLTSNKAGPAAKTSVMTGGGEQVYVTADSVYLFASKPREPSANGMIDWNAGSQTSVWKFAMNGQNHSTKLAAKGDFDGSLLNQFAADERDGYLRIVSKSDGWNGSGQSVLVLGQVGKHLNVVGSVSGIAADESLYSVRFVGNRAFFVTFRRFDPLFAVDLSNPTAPKLMGELQIPGYSEYLQPIDENHLLGIGRDTSTWAGGAEEPDALQVSIFDVSDLSHPLLTDRFAFGGGYSTVTPATGGTFLRNTNGDHHAVSYFADAHILALPVNTIEGYSGWWGTGTSPLFEAGHGGLRVFTVDAAGLTPVAMIEHDTLIERSLEIGDRLFAISSGTLSVHSMSNPNVELGRINVGAAAEMQPVELKMYQAASRIAGKQSINAASKHLKNPTAPPLATDHSVWDAVASSAGKGISPSLETRHSAKPRHVEKFSGFQGARHFDNNLLQLLATDSASVKSSDKPIKVQSSRPIEIASQREFADSVQSAVTPDVTTH
jgi:hypothetical protein